MKEIYFERLNIAALVSLVLILRICLLGLSPHSDEGHYAAQAYLHYLSIHSNTFNVTSLLPAVGGLELYTLLFSWLYFIPIEPLFLFRILDGLFAVIASIAIYKFLLLVVNCRVSALITSVIIVICLNHPNFIEAGARNPIPLATCFLFFALYYIEKLSNKNFVLAGALISMAVLIREPFAVFVPFVALYIWWCYDFRNVVRFSLSGLLVGVFVIVVVSLLKGGFEGAAAMYEAYTNTHFSSAQYNLTLPQKLARAMSKGSNVVSQVSFCIPMLLFGLITPLLNARYRTKKTLGIFMLGIVMMLLPLFEIIFKRSYSYHFSMMLFGATIPLAYGIHMLIATTKKFYKESKIKWGVFFILILVAHVALLKDTLRTFYYSAARSAHFFPATVLGNMNHPSINDSYFLKISSIINQQKAGYEALVTLHSIFYPLKHKVT